jgi:hypothetical protein
MSGFHDNSVLISFFISARGKRTRSPSFKREFLLGVMATRPASSRPAIYGRVAIPKLKSLYNRQVCQFCDSLTNRLLKKDEDGVLTVLSSLSDSDLLCASV